MVSSVSRGQSFDRFGVSLSGTGDSSSVSGGFFVFACFSPGVLRYVVFWVHFLGGGMGRYHNGELGDLYHGFFMGYHL